MGYPKVVLSSDQSYRLRLQHRLRAAFENLENCSSEAVTAPLDSK